MTKQEWITTMTLTTVVGSVMVLSLIVNVINHIFGKCLPAGVPRIVVLGLSLLISYISAIIISNLPKDDTTYFNTGLKFIILFILNGFLIYSMAYGLPLGNIK